MTPREQEVLVQRVMDGEATQEDIAAFQGAFRDNANFRQRYYYHATLATYLETSTNPQLVLGGAERSGQLDLQGRKLLKMSWVWAAAAVVMLSLAARFFYLQPWVDPDSGQMSLSAGTRWSVQHAVGGMNQNEEARALAMLPGSSLKLEQGVAEIGFPSGMRVVLSGATALTYHGEGRFHLDHGKAWFDIPDGADGVVLSTPHMRVIDQGTRFGVISSKTQADEVHVVSGEVLVEGLTGRRSRAVVRAARAVAVDWIGEVRELGFESNKFSKTLPRRLPCLHWSFDSHEGGRFGTEGEHPRIGEIRAEYRSPSATPLEERSSAGVIGNSVSFKQPGDMVVTTYQGVRGAGPRTLSFWLRLPPERAGEFKRGNWIGLLGWGRRHHPDHSHNESIHAIVGAPHLPRPAGSSVRHPVPVLSFEGVWFEGETNIADGEWHHLVWTLSGQLDEDGAPEVTCYCDGRAEPLRGGGLDRDRLMRWPPQIDTVIDHEESVPLILGGSLLSIEDRESLAPAEMDEVFIIEGTVDEVEARRLFLENRYEPAPPQQIIVADSERAEKSAD